jgi:hypothetical protein
MLKICYRRFSSLSSNCSGLSHQNLPVMFALFGVNTQEDLGVAYLSVCLGSQSNWIGPPAGIKEGTETWGVTLSQVISSIINHLVATCNAG